MKFEDLNFEIDDRCRTVARVEFESGVGAEVVKEYRDGRYSYRVNTLRNGKYIVATDPLWKIAGCFDFPLGPIGVICVLVGLEITGNEERKESKMKYYYEALGEQGETVEGVEEAGSQSDCMKKLRDKGLFVTKMRTEEEKLAQEKKASKKTIFDPSPVETSASDHLEKAKELLKKKLLGLAGVAETAEVEAGEAEADVAGAKTDKAEEARKRVEEAARKVKEAEEELEDKKGEMGEAFDAIMTELLEGIGKEWGEKVAKWFANYKSKGTRQIEALEKLATAVEKQQDNLEKMTTILGKMAIIMEKEFGKKE